MSETYQSPLLLAAGRLGPDTPLGLFKPLERREQDELFWVVEREGRRFAVFIRSDPRWLFEAFPLSEETDDWNGISLGPVEVLLDTSSVSFQASLRTHLGAITLGDGLVRLGARSREGSPIRFEIGSCAPSPGQVSVLFPNWQLIQRDYDGRPIVLFDRTKQ